MQKALEASKWAPASKKDHVYETKKEYANDQPSGTLLRCNAIDHNQHGVIQAIGMTFLTTEQKEEITTSGERKTLWSQHAQHNIETCTNEYTLKNDRGWPAPCGCCMHYQVKWLGHKMESLRVSTTTTALQAKSWMWGISGAWRKCHQNEVTNYSSTRC